MSSLLENTRGHETLAGVCAPRMTSPVWSLLIPENDGWHDSETFRYLAHPGEVTDSLISQSHFVVGCMRAEAGDTDQTPGFSGARKSGRVPVFGGRWHLRGLGCLGKHAKEEFWRRLLLPRKRLLDGSGRQTREGNASCDACLSFAELTRPRFEARSCACKRFITAATLPMTGDEHFPSPSDTGWSFRELGLGRPRR